MPLSSFPVIGASAGEWISGFWSQYLAPHWESFKQLFLGEDLLIQLASVFGAFVLAYIVTLGLRPMFRKITEAIEERDDWIEESIDWVSDNLFRLLVVGLLWSVSLYLDSAALKSQAEQAEAPKVVESAPPVVTASEEGVAVAQGDAVAAKEGADAPAKNYILVRAVASVMTLLLVSGALPKRIKQQVYYKTLFFVLAVVLILNLLGIWTVIRGGLDGIRIFPISESGETNVTLLSFVKGLLAILLLIPLTGWLLRTTESRVGKMQDVSPAFQVLVLKFIKVGVAVAAVLFAISAMGVNLSTFAVLGGAIGLGLGFGFQKVISNLISGVILLGDKSIKPGDVIEVDQTYGWINTLGARYTSVITRDGTEHLIPNEMMITEKVVNWSFTDDKVRVKIGFGVSYTSDIHKAMELALRAANEDARVLKEPTPAVRLTGYGDNSVDFEMRAWIVDPVDGIGNIRSSFYIAIWDLFKEHGIEFPYPQRDLHVKQLPPVDVRVRREDD